MPRQLTKYRFQSFADPEFNRIETIPMKCLDAVYEVLPVRKRAYCKGASGVAPCVLIGIRIEGGLEVPT